MKILYQFAQKDPTGWQEIDSHDWASLAKLPLPTDTGGKDNQEGWIRNVSVQGITTEGYDHVAIEPITIGNDEGVKMTVWNDDPDDFPEGEKNAIVWTILPLAADPKVGMAINTRQSCIRYAEGARYDRLVNDPPQNTTIRPWKEFVPPDESITRHGVWLETEKFQEHLEAAPQAEYSWMDWTEGLPDSETEPLEEVRLGGIAKATKPRRRLKEQRAQGRYRQAEHTITYYQRNTDRPISVSSSNHEDALELTTATSATESITLDTSFGAWAFTTAANQPNSSDWPNGTYHQQVNCTAASVGVVYGCPSFRRLNAAMSGLISNHNLSNGSGDGDDFSGTGLKLSSATFDPTAGNADEVFCSLLNAQGDSMSDAITLTLNTTDSYADGPWTAGGGAPATPDDPVLPPQVIIWSWLLLLLGLTK